MNKSAVALGILALVCVAFAQGSDVGQNINENLAILVNTLQSIVPVVVLGLFVFAGVVYAVGQAFDASTRQKAQSWAMAMIVGGIIGILIVIVAPWLVRFLLGFSGTQ